MLNYTEFINESDKPNIKKYDIDGFVVYLGKDAKSNDYLTFELSNEDDLWFHAKSIPGSHVLIKVKDKLPSEQVIKKVAEIAAKNSKHKEDNVTVLYCKKKFVTKEQDMVDGKVKVDYTNSYEIIIKL